MMQPTSVCPSVRRSARTSVRVETLHAGDAPWASRMVAAHFGSDRVVSRGVLHDTSQLPGFIAWRGGVRCGLLQWNFVTSSDVGAPLGADWKEAVLGTRDGMEVVTLVADPQGQGIGRRLLDRAEQQARALPTHRLWLITTDNNVGGLAFYRSLGWIERHHFVGAIETSRRLKPEIPETDSDGRPIRDEILFESPSIGS